MRHVSAFDRRFGHRGLARTATLFGRGRFFRYRCRGRSGGNGRCRFSRSRFDVGFGTNADRRRQAGRIESGGRFVFAPFAARAAFGAGAQATARGTVVAHERVVAGIGDGFTLDCRDAFAGQHFCGHHFAFAIAFTLAVEPAVVTTTFVAVIARPVITVTIFAVTAAFVTIFTWAIVARTVIPLATFVAIITLSIFAGSIIALPVLAGAIFTIPAAFIAIFAFLTAGRAVECREIAFDAEIAAVVFAFLILPAFTAAAVLAGALFFLAGPGIGDHAEVVVGKLQIVFSLHAVTIKVRVLCKLAILFEQLGGIAPRTAVDPVELLTTILRAIVVTPPAPAVVTTIVIQLRHFLN